MILFVTLNIILLIVIHKIIKQTGLIILLSYFLSVLFFAIFYIEVQYSDVSLFFSDEVGFQFRAADQVASGQHSRLLWYYINYLILNYDTLFGDVVLKVINIPISAGALILLWYLFKKNNSIFLLPIFLVYYPYMATLNIRDMLIYFFTISGAVSIPFNNKKNLPFFIISLLGLYYLRLSQAMLLFTLSVVFHLVSDIRLSRGDFRAFFMKNKGLIVTAVFVCVVFVYFNSQFQTNLSWGEHLFGSEREIYLEKADRNPYATGNLPRDLVVYGLRYIFTPLPTSVLRHWRQGRSYEWGTTEVFLRLINQISYYGLLLYLLINCKYIGKVLRGLKVKELVLLSIFFCYFPIYSIYLYGQGHQRTKLPFQIVVFIVALLIWQYKKNLRIKRAHNNLVRTNQLNPIHRKRLSKVE